MHRHTDPPETRKESKMPAADPHIAAAILAAQEALKQFYQSAPHDQELSKIVSAHAVQRARAGESVTADYLLHALHTRGKEALRARKSAPHARPATLTYASVIAHLSQKAPAAPLNPIQLVEAPVTKKREEPPITHVLRFPATDTRMQLTLHNANVTVVLPDQASVPPMQLTLNSAQKSWLQILMKNTSNTIMITHLLDCAVRYQSTELVKQILSASASSDCYGDGLYYAATYGNMEILEYIVEQWPGFSTTLKDSTRALRAAGEEGHWNVAQYLVKQGADPSILHHIELSNEEQHPHNYTKYLPVADYLIASAENPKATETSLLRAHVRNGNTKVVQYLAERGADLGAITHQDIATSCHVRPHEVVNLLEYLKHKGAEVRLPPQTIKEICFGCVQHNALSPLVYLLNDYPEEERQYLCTILLPGAAQYGRLMDVVHVLLEHGAHASTQDNWALKVALKNGQIALAQKLLACGATTHTLDPDQKETADLILRWQRVSGTPPTHEQVILSPPEYYKPEAYRAVQSMLEQEGYGNELSQYMAYAASAVFGTEQRVLHYLKKWGKAGTQPLHDLIQHIRIPKATGLHFASWGDALLKCGPSMQRMIQFADRVPQPAKSSDGKTWSYQNTKALCRRFTYARAEENPEMADFCFENMVDDPVFNEALDLLPHAPRHKNIPDIHLQGESFGMHGARFYKLDNRDWRGLFLGEITDCCQSIGGEGADCARQGYTSQNSGFYVVEKENGHIVGQTWAWRGTEGELVFDSLETLGEHMQPHQWKSLLQRFAGALTPHNPHNISALHVGTGGGTPKALSCTFNAASSPARAVDTHAYSDAKKQLQVWKNSY